MNIKSDLKMSLVRSSRVVNKMIFFNKIVVNSKMTSLSTFRNFTSEEEAFVESVAQNIEKAIDLEELCPIVRKKQIQQVTTESQIELARKGIRFATRTKVTLRQMVHDMETHYILSNPFRLDYIVDIVPAVVQSGARFGSKTHSIKVNGPTIVPVADIFTFYRFEKGEFDLDVELVGVIFGNAMRKLYNKVTMMTSADFFVNYNYPHILSPAEGEQRVWIPTPIVPKIL